MNLFTFIPISTKRNGLQNYYAFILKTNYFENLFYLIIKIKISMT